MDTRLLAYYEKELQYIREAGSEFAHEYPKIAGRLGIETLECSDPYVERLLESFAFLAARIQLKHDSEMPRFTQHLLEMVYPHYLCPLPSMCIVQLQPNDNVGELDEGFLVAKQTPLRGTRGAGSSTECEFRTVQDVQLLPIEISEAAFYNRDVASLALPAALRSATAALRIRLRLNGNVSWQDLQLENLVVHITGPDEVPVQLYEQIVANTIGLAIQAVGGPKSDPTILPRERVRPLGFDGDRLLPYTGRSFEGYALLQEYFALPQRFLFFEISGMRNVIRKVQGQEIDIILAFDGTDLELGRIVDKSCFHLHCTPAVNLFPRRADAVQLKVGDIEHHVVPDRSRPLDYEIFQISKVIGYSDDKQGQEFHPFFSIHDTGRETEETFYSLTRMPRMVSTRQQQKGARSSYLGSECFLSLVDNRFVPQTGHLRTLAVETLCTNRDLPLHMPVGALASDFTTATGAPVDAIKCISGPTPPYASRAHVRGELLWRTVNHLSLNYLSLVNQDATHGAVALRSLLSIYASDRESSLRKQIESIRTITSRGVTRQLPDEGPVSFCRGIEISLTLDETGFKGRGAFLLGAILEQFFSRYVSINSFTETILKSEQRGEIKRWPARLGRRHLI